MKKLINALSIMFSIAKYYTQQTRMWANAQRDGGPAEHRWRPLLSAAKIG